MTVLTKDKDVGRKEAGLQSFPVGTDIIYKGAMVCLNTAGYLVAAADTAGYRFVGIAYEKVDNSAGLSGVNCRVYTRGVFEVTAVATLTQAMVGKPMYVVDDQSFDDVTGVSNFVCCGRLVEFSSTTSGWIDIGQRELDVGSGPDNLIYVSKRGSTGGVGTIHDPFSTITAALAAVTTTKKTIFIDPGDYAEAAMLTWPNIDGVRLIGTDLCGNVVISNANAAAAVIKINPTYTATTLEAFLENVCIKHDAQIGIQIDNANMTRKLLIHLKNVSAEQVSTGDSIDIPHTTAGQAIRVYAEGCDEIEGLVDIVCANTDDRFRFINCTLIGGLTETGAVAGELLLHACVILEGALTVNAAMVLTYRASMYRTDAGVYTELADGYSA